MVKIQKRLAKMPIGPNNADFTQFDENEEATCLSQVTYIQRSWFKTLIVAPLLSVLSLMIFALYLYWYQKTRKNWLYSEVDSIDKATHVFVHGQDHKMAIVPL